ncbi:SOS-response repressor and protease LexA [Dehalobacter sp. UNSWDHB]|uniref:transcriptional repressor LexA n=1 Tax=unclassified Dehalobacter TaxID=2635733 RepID=UPI00028A7D5D|nr:MULTISPECIES: transcriptional repressor LexA [unclassified Dehalobacter]AFV01642.1 SOS-response repressor and protease LexA [Dehalobacter sp. DCA]AFV04678.1 SOS-response repressor and protease LexA [Dehalobacter sp. CF]EQB21967.1 SOS-response repressor and protease LexA [Dehalobacter sp. UNSWDHB]
MTSDLSSRQMQILDIIKKEIALKGYPPSVREIGEAVGLSSSSTVHNHLNILEEKGYIRRDPTKPRAIEVLDSFGEYNSRKIVHVPVVGHVAAGEPILAIENIEDSFPVPYDMVKSDTVFMLKVQGESMIDAGIFDDDLILVRQQQNASNGDIVVALVSDGPEDGATVKRFYKEKNQIRLQPENQYMEPIYSDHVTILGKVIGLFRDIH